MAAANAAWQGYQTVQSVRDLAGGRKNIGEIGISISYRQQKNRSEVRSDLSRAQESRINAGGKTGRGNGHGADENHRHSHIGSSMQGERVQSWGCSDGMGWRGYWARHVP